jgi:hypothetical protein
MDPNLSFGEGKLGFVKSKPLMEWFDCDFTLDFAPKKKVKGEANQTLARLKFEKGLPATVTIFSGQNEPDKMRFMMALMLFLMPGALVQQQRQTAKLSLRLHAASPIAGLNSDLCKDPITD